MSTVDQHTIRRRGTGLKAHDPALAYDGYTLFAPMFGDGTVYLIDMNGKTAHTWKLPHAPGLYGYLLDNGNLFYGGKPMQEVERLPLWQRAFKAGSVMEVDWRGRVLWEVRHPDHHHDARKLSNGNVMLLCMEKIARDLIPRVQGGLPGTEDGGEMYADYLVEMTTTGQRVWEWHSATHMDPNTDRINPQDRREEWTHGNTVAERADGNLVVSFRNISTVVIIERPTGKVIWKLGPPTLAQQHDPRPLPNGNLLIFDNGAHRRDSPLTYSRVIEVNPRTSEIVWEYRDPVPFNFFSPYISGAQRLANGNTLVCEGCFGRLFEITAAGAVVWEYVSPYLGPSPRFGPVNWVFRAFRYGPDEIARARESR